MKKFTRTFALIAALIAVMAISTTALATATPEEEAAPVSLLQTVMDAPDPEAAFLALPPADRADVIEQLNITSVEVVTNVDSTGDVTMTTGGCANQNSHILGRSNSGLLAYRFNSFTHWCYDGSVHTIVPDVEVTGNTYLLFWSYTGLRWFNESGGLDQWYHHDSAQGEFKLCVTDFGCIQYKYPTIRKSQYGDGSSLAN